MAQRVTIFEIYGVSSIFTSVEYLLNDFRQAVINNGWGVDYTSFKRTWIGTPYWEIGIVNSNNYNVADMQSALRAIAGDYLSDVDVQYVGDHTYTDDGTGHQIVTDTYQNQTQQDPSLWQQIFGNDSAIDAGGKILGLSVGTIALLAVGYVLITRATK